MISICPIKRAVLSGTGDATSGYLLDVEVGEIGLRINVFRDCEGDGGHGNGFAEEPAYALLSGRRDEQYVGHWGDRYAEAVPFEECNQCHQRGSCSTTRSIET